ncbi:MAG: cell division protein ZapE [Oceanospirillaceae bacterium]
MPTPLELYQQDIETKGFKEDEHQAFAIKALHQLYLDIMAEKTTAASSVYLWGKVGRGKTYLMDCFFRALGTRVKRLHYYRFMQYLHARLKAHQGQPDPLTLVAKDLLKEHKILCLDEFFVADIGDAMLLGRLMQVLFEQGLILVTTSNVEPCQLYKEGLQRDRFLPAIKMLESHLQIVAMQGREDHRLAKSQGFKHYFVQQSHDEIDSSVLKRFTDDVEQQHNLLEVAGKPNIERNLTLQIESRPVACLARYNDLYCFSFEQLFIGPRSVNDYIALSKIAQRLYLINVPQLGGALLERKVARGTEDTYNINQRVADRPFIVAKGDDEARRFISFVDEMYDQGKLIVIGAQVPLATLYLGGRVVFEFARTSSRIIEMQSM